MSAPSAGTAPGRRAATASGPDGAGASSGAGGAGAAPRPADDGHSTPPWSRLHPLSPLIRSSRAVVAVLLVLVPRPLIFGDRGSLVVELVILGVAVAGAAVSWLVTRWRLHGAELQIETGLVRRQSIRIPLRRVQAVDLVRPLGARITGLAEVRVVLAGQGVGHEGLSFLTLAHAQRVREQLLALAPGPAGPAAVVDGVQDAEPAVGGWSWPGARGKPRGIPPSGSPPLVTTSTARLLASLLLSLPALALVLLLVGWGIVTARSGDAATVAGLVPVVLGFGGALGRRLNYQFGTTATAGPRALQVTSGLLQTRVETVAYDRVQAVRWVEPLLWRPLGWCRLEVDVARQRDAHEEPAANPRLDRALLPVGTRAEAQRVLDRLLPAADLTGPVRHRPPRRARWQKAPLSYRNLGVWADETLLVTSEGRLRRTRVVVPLAKVQSLRLVQGPYARRLQLATLHVDLAGRGGWGAVARCRDQAEAALLLDTLAARARSARRVGMPT